VAEDGSAATAGPPGPASCTGGWEEREMVGSGENPGCVCTDVQAGSLCSPCSVPLFDGEENVLESG